MTTRDYRKSGYYAAKRAFSEHGSRAIDGRSKAGRALAEWSSAIVQDLGGEDTISAQQMALLEEFTVVHSKPEWLEIGEAARLLSLAGKADAETGRRGQRCPYLRPILGYGLLTGARPNETFGAHVSDVNFKKRRVYFRHNEWRLLKRPWHEGEVPLWPQLEEILKQYIERWQPTDLLFPSHITGRMYTNINDALRVLFKEARIFKKPRLYITRHTYCATRLQTLDRGAACESVHRRRRDAAQRPRTDNEDLRPPPAGPSAVSGG